MQDRFIKIMLVVVAALLAGNLLQSMMSSTGPSIISSAQAQPRNEAQALTESAATVYQLKVLSGFPVEDLKTVVPLGDGRSFVASNPKGFMVYQVLPKK